MTDSSGLQLPEGPEGHEMTFRVSLSRHMPTWTKYCTPCTHNTITDHNIVYSVGFVSVTESPIFSKQSTKSYGKITTMSHC